MLSRGPPKDRPYDGMSQLSQQQRRTLGDLGEEFPKLRRVRGARDTERARHPSVSARPPTSAGRSLTRRSPLARAAQDIDLANDDIARVKKFQKYLKDNGIMGLANQMKIYYGLKAEGVLSDRVAYTLHTLIAGNSIGRDLKDPFKALNDPVNQKK